MGTKQLGCSQEALLRVSINTNTDSRVCPPSLQGQKLTTQIWDQFMNSTVVNDHAG